MHLLERQAMEAIEAPTRESSTVIPDLTIPELSAVLQHKYMMSCNTGDWISMPYAISDFFSERTIENPVNPLVPFTNYARKFRDERNAEDWRLQQEKINQEIKNSEERLGRELSEDEKKFVLYDWRGFKAEEWRDKRDSMREIFGNKYEEIIIPSVHDVLAIKRKVIEKLCPYWCDVFFYQEGMQDPDFTVEHKPYQDAKRRIKKENADVSIIPNKRLELLLIGDKSKEAAEGLISCLCGNVLFEIPEEDRNN
jgi:hypothetical protein